MLVDIIAGHRGLSIDLGYGALSKCLIHDEVPLTLLLTLVVVVVDVVANIQLYQFIASTLDNVDFMSSLSIVNT